MAKGRDRTGLYAWYNLGGSFATALGSLAAGAMAQAAGYRDVILGYGVLGAALGAMFAFLSPAVNAKHDGSGRIRSRGIIAKLSALFALDSFAGGLVVQSILAWWFYRRFGLSPAVLGSIFFGANILAGISALAAARLAKRFGLLNTMVFTHLPSNILLLLVPFMPTLSLAIIDVVEPSERTAAAGITGVARTTGAALAPILAVPLISGSHDWLPFVAAGVLKVIYDLLLLRSFKTREPSSRQSQTTSPPPR